MNTQAEIKFTIRSETIELYKLLKAVGVCESGGSAKYAISQGWVKVDGQIETRKACQIKSGQSVEFENHLIKILIDKQTSE